MSEPLLTVREVAERVGLSEWAVRRAIHAGELGAHKIRGQLRSSERDFDAWLASTRVTPTADKPPIPRTPIRKQRTMALRDFELSA